MQLTIEQRLIRNHKLLATHEMTMAYTGLIMLGDVKVDDSPSVTAYTDGFNCVYGRTFCDGLSDPELRAVILHECLHKAFMHLIVYMSLAMKNMNLANQACDYYINLIIHFIERDSNGFIKLPQGALLDLRFQDVSTPEIFKMLETEQKQSGDKPKQNFDEHGWEDAQSIPEDKKAEIAEQIKQAIFEGNKLSSKKGGGGTDRALTDLLVPKIDYRDVMRQFATDIKRGGDDISYARPDRRRQGGDVIMPTREEETLGRGVWAFDMSASISNQEALRLVSEAVGCFKQCSPEAVDILYWDTKVAGHETYQRDEFDSIAQKTKPVGGGGTNVQCVIDYISKNRLDPEFIVVFTDNYLGGDYGRGWSTDKILWVITEYGSNDKPTVGSSIRIN